MTADLTEFIVEVVRIPELTPHPNADTLDIAQINGYPVIVKRGNFKPGDLAVYVPIDSLVNTTYPEFSFLHKDGKERHRVRAARLRGIFSMGLLVPARAGMVEGDRVHEALDVQKYIPPSERNLESGSKAVVKSAKTNKANALMPIYGLAAYRRYGQYLEEGLEVWVSEKIHGCSARYCYHGGQLWVGSHRAFRGTTPNRLKVAWERIKAWWHTLLNQEHRMHLVRDAGDVWWEIAKQYDLANKLKAHPDMVLYGEIYGESVQDLTYDSPKGRKFVGFDVLDVKAGRFLDVEECQAFILSLGLPLVPTLYKGPWHPDLLKFVDGKTTLGGKHLREGVVVKAMRETFHPNIGRVSLKIVSEAYLLRKDG